MLTDAKARKALPGDRDYKLADSQGLFLLVRPTGGKLWRMKYRFAGKEKLLSFGLYPEVALIEARDLRDAARKLLRAGVDPSIEKPASPPLPEAPPPPALKPSPATGTT